LSSGRFTLLLKNCLVYDGTGTVPTRAHIGIAGDTIAMVAVPGVEEGLGAERVMDLEGLAVAPGFIDTHGHSDFTSLAAPEAESKVLQGITTEINGNCGLSAAPLLGAVRAQREGDLKTYGIEEEWESFDEYFGVLAGRRPVMNMATLTGHGNIRASVMGYASAPPTDEELARMKSLLERSLEGGVRGLSSGLIYPPGIYAQTGELTALAQRGVSVQGEGFLYATHMRSEGERLLESAEEACTIGRHSGARVHISHIKTAGRENWHKADGLIALLEDARASGVRVTCDRYPYTASSTDLDAVLPRWVFEGGNQEELKRLKDGAVRDRITAEMKAGDQDWKSVHVSEVATEKNRWMEGKSIVEIARACKTGPAEAVVSVLVQEELRVGAVFHGMSEENLKRFYSLPYVMVGSDSSSRSFSGPTRRGKPHPRGFGSFPRFLSKYAEACGGLAEALRRITMLPAGTFGLLKRGVIRSGYFADVVVFDPERITDEATYEDPYRKPAGIRHVIVNGRVVASDGKMTGERPGRVLRR
jgi:N-acyl-D-amino-acid deacylase